MRFSAAAIGMIGLCAASSSAAAAGWRYDVVASSASGNRQQIGNLNLVGNAVSLNDAGEATFTGFATVNGIYTGEVWISRHGNPAVAIASVAANDYPLQSTINRAGSVSFSDLSQNGNETTQIVTVTKAGITRFPTVFNGSVWASIVNGNRVIVQTGGELDLVSGETLKPISSGFCEGSFSVASNASGQVAFSNCFYENEIYVASANFGYAKLRVATTAQIGQAAQPAINDLNMLAFTGTAVAGQTGNVTALYTEAPGGAIGLVSYVNNGACSYTGPPGGIGSCTLTSYYTPSINTAGEIALDVVVSSFIGTNSTFKELVAINGDLAHPVLSTGSVLDRCMITGIQTGTQALNNAGQVAALLTCADQSSRVVIATPAA